MRPTQQRVAYRMLLRNSFMLQPPGEPHHWMADDTTASESLEKPVLECISTTYIFMDLLHRSIYVLCTTLQIQSAPYHATPSAQLQLHHYAPSAAF